MPYKHLKTARDGGVERLVLNRPEARNALNDEVIAELIDWADAVRKSGDVRVVVLAGAGKTFSAGADVGWMARTIEHSRAENMRDASAFSRMFVALDTLPVPVVGRVQGGALGGGAGLAAVCDIVVAEDRTVFGFTEVRLGIVPAVISPFVLSKIGQSAARELFLTGARFSAERAREIGLVHLVVAPEALDEAVEATVRDLLLAPPEAIATAKGLISYVGKASPGDVHALTARVIAARRVSAEGQEGLERFSKSANHVGWWTVSGPGGRPPTR
jgi:methylglutaconyl-CoA hydratase